MRRWSIILILVICGRTASAHEAIYAMTPLNTVEVKSLPPAATLTAKADGPYFDHFISAFKRLSSYKKEHDITTTVPVEADPDERSQMRIYLSSQDTRRTLPTTNSVAPGTITARTVVSTGLKGEYRQKLFESGVAILKDWLEKNPDWKQAGAPYVVYWDGPFRPGFLKRSEVHIPIQKREGS